MGRRVNIPVRVIRPGESSQPWTANPEPVVRPGSRSFEGEATTDLGSEDNSQGPRPFGGEPQIAPSAEAPGAPEQIEAQRENLNRGESCQVTPKVDGQDETEAWREQALRLQAEMDNFRKRQQRRADEQIEQERHRMLGAFLQTIDDLERALAASGGDGQSLRQGVELIHRSALRLLQQEGVEPIEAKGQRFDPHWHEAVATIKQGRQALAPHTIAQVVEPGYRLGERLLRPAKVVVAVE